MVSLEDLVGGKKIEMNEKTVRELIELALRYADEDGELPDDSPAVCVRRPENYGEPIYPKRDVEELTRMVLEGCYLSVRIVKDGRVGFFDIDPRDGTATVSIY